MEFFTIGVYNSTEEAFLKRLIEAKIDTFCDVRQRRGVRGSKYAFVNSIRLQTKLKLLGIRYLHINQLAPSTEIRSIQKASDSTNQELKRERTELSDGFVSSYSKQILDKFDWSNFIKELGIQGSSKIALFCVEENPCACHRSLIAAALKKKFEYRITDL